MRADDWWRCDIANQSRKIGCKHPGSGFENYSQNPMSHSNVLKFTAKIKFLKKLFNEVVSISWDNSKGLLWKNSPTTTTCTELFIVNSEAIANENVGTAERHVLSLSACVEIRQVSHTFRWSSVRLWGPQTDAFCQCGRQKSDTVFVSDFHRADTAPTPTIDIISIRLPCCVLSARPQKPERNFDSAPLEQR